MQNSCLSVVAALSLQESSQESKQYTILLYLITEITTRQSKQYYQKKLN